ncbi:hypothetical protein Cgig2_031958 [Carnegiea gigantea]|uniref:Alcohol dehydrogenase-like 7 n=1 Tax=Carnegiea gigantea TaxID=171969 RepID=A0A9Q1K6A7_9CARY|nr:hypothetical protein Cgig2_031958 [Carnegiea gigantea]
MAEKSCTSTTAGRPIRCKAAIAREPGQPLVMEEVIVAPPKAHEVRIKIICTSLCHTDVTVWKLKHMYRVVESVGEGVEEVAEGDYVVPVYLADCGECKDCKSTKSNLCVGAAWRTANVEPGSTVAIFGLGSIGLAVAEGARLCGASKIIAVDINHEKFETGAYIYIFLYVFCFDIDVGKKFGVTDFINPESCGDKTVSQVINEMTDGGADYCFECVGMGWGKTVVIGLAKPGSEMRLDSMDVLCSGKTLIGTLFGGLKPKRDIPVLVKRYMDKELQLDEFVSHEMKFDDINEAFELLIQGKCLRCVLYCGECRDCKSTKSNLCSKFPFSVSPWMPRDDTSRFTDLNGQTLFHFLFVSSFSQYTVIDVAHVTKIDPSVPPNRACLLSCGASTGVGAAWKTANVEPGSTVAIFGLGSIGLAVAEGARLCGASKIIAVDINPEKFETGKKFGVTDFVNSQSCGDKTVSEVIKDMTDGGADYCFECVGMVSLIQEAFASCRKELRLDEFVTHEMKFDDINEAFELLVQGKIVESAGENVNEVAEGDYVMPVFLANCGDCKDCKSKKSNLCSTLPFKPSPCMPRDGTSRFTDLNGETLYHCLHVSSFSQYTVVDIAHITKVDSAIPPNRACLLSCGVSTGVGAAWRTAQVESGSTVAIFGLGAIGLAVPHTPSSPPSLVLISYMSSDAKVAEGARLCGATTIIGVDINPDKYETGKKFGVTHFVNPATVGPKSVSEVIKEMTDGGADYCFECVGLVSLVEEAYACCRKGWGKTVVLGVDKPTSMLNIASMDVLNGGGKTLTGSIFGGLKAKSDVSTLVKWYLNKDLQLDEFVTHEMKFDDVNKAFELLLKGKCLRCKREFAYVYTLEKQNHKL